LSGTVPVDQILNANPAWVRVNIDEDLEPLVADIKKNGVLSPVLIAPDFLVVDGARRVRAAQVLGIAAIPATVTNDWGKILKYLHSRTNSKPMNWLEIEDLVHRILTELYKPVRWKRAVDSRRAKTGKRRNSIEGSHTMFVEELAPALRLSIAQLRTIQDLGATLRTAENIDPALANRIRRTINGIEQESGALFGADRIVRDMLRAHRHNMSNAPEPDPKLAREQERIITGIAEVLSHVLKGATEFTATTINPAVRTEVVEQVLNELARFRYGMRGFSKVLKNYAIGNNKERDDQQEQD